MTGSLAIDEHVAMSHCRSSDGHSSYYRSYRRTYGSYDRSYRRISDLLESIRIFDFT